MAKFSPQRRNDRNGTSDGYNNNDIKDIVIQLEH